MDIQDLKAVITEKFGEDEFRELIMEQVEDAEDFDAEIGLHYKFLKLDEEYEGEDSWKYTYRFQIGEKLYQVVGWYNSWDGSGIENVMSFVEVKPVKKTITVYEPV